MVEHFYYPIGEIIERLQIGGGKRKLSNTIRLKNKESTKFKEKLVELGWTPEYVNDTFHYLTDTLLQNWPQHVLIKGLFKIIIRNQGWKNTLHESLLGIGLCDDVVMKLVTILEPLLDSCYTHIQLLDIAIEYILEKYKTISPPNARFLYNPEVISMWSEIKIKEKSYSIYNIPYFCDNKIVRKEIKDNLIHSDEYTYYFHATSWRGSTQIMKRINRTYGRTCLDFGKNPGFYLATTIKDSIEWCKKNKLYWGNESSIIVFRIPNELPPTISIKHLKDGEWVAITKESRECENEKEEIETLCDYDLLYGNMVRNPTAVQERRELPQTHQPPKQQLVGRSDAADRFLQSCLIGCFYFQKNDE
jgi:hypothetical protein